MAMMNPVHPGSVILGDCVEAEELTIDAAARELGVSRQTLSGIINGRSSVTADMSIRLEKRGWGRADMWMRMQASYDLAQARLRSDEIDVPWQRRA